MNFDKFMDRQHSRNYTCHDFSKEIWKEITGEDLKDGDREEIKKPTSPCLVYLSNSTRMDSHIGVFFQGKVFHLGLRNPQYIPLELLTVAFKSVRFYK